MSPISFAINVTLTMKKSVPIRGKVVSLEGQPIAGAKVEVYMLQRPEPAKFTTWLKQDRARLHQRSNLR